MKHQRSFIKRCQTLPCVLLRAFLLGMLLTESLTMMAGFGSPTYAHGSDMGKKTGRPDLFISESHLGGDHFQVGDEITFIIVVGNNLHAGSTTSTITVSDAVLAGIRNLRASGRGWDIVMSDTRSPTVITAKYPGNDSVYGGEILPAIKISGKLTEDAIPHLTSIARVHTECGCDTSNLKAADTISVVKAGHGQECNQCNEKKEHQGCQEREECLDKSGTSPQGDSSANSTLKPTSTPNSAIYSSIAVSSVAVASSNTYNIFGSVEDVPRLSGVGNRPGSGETGNIPGLPNTGSNPNAGRQ